MALLTLKVQHADGSTACVNRGEDEVNLVYSSRYEEGDKIILESSDKNIFIKMQIDDALGEAFLYLANSVIYYEVPMEEKRTSYSPKVFCGEKHLLTARVATNEEISVYKNLALNVMDQHGDKGYFPHASANVETRGEAVFAARNAIDGVKVTNSHGEWPYESWGINQRADATIKVDFGRDVTIDKIVLYLRADFPHDNWWKQVTVRFSDETTMELYPVKSGKAQVFQIEKKTIHWIQLENLIKSEESSPFPALTQIEVYGVEAN